MRMTILAAGEENIVRGLLARGFTLVLPWRAEPGEVDFEHAHTSDSKQIIVEGQITFFIEGQELLLRAGETFSIPAGLAHGAMVGPRGCYYIFALR